MLPGPALEESTVLGLLLRRHVEPRSPEAREPFNEPFRLPPHEREARARGLLSATVARRAAHAALFRALVGAGPLAKDVSLRWLCDCLACNLKADAAQPDPMQTSSEGFLLNVCAVLLALCAPFTGNLNKEEKIDSGTTFFASSHGAFPVDLTLLSGPGELSLPASSEETNFITQCFFLTWRALHLSLVAQLSRIKSFSDQIDRHHYHNNMAGIDPAEDVNFKMMYGFFIAMQVQFLKQLMSQKFLI